MKLRRNIVKTIFFVLIFLFLSIGASKLVTAPNYRAYQNVAGFYREPAGTLDAVYIGSSGVYSSCLPPVIWSRSGITLWNYATQGQTITAAKSVIEETRKTQPDALFIIYTGSPYIPGDVNIHKLVDYMPLSGEKLKMIHKLCEMGGIPEKDRFEFYVPMFLYHTRWNDLVKEDFTYKLKDTKASSEYSEFLEMSKNVSKDIIMTEKRGELKAEVEDYLLDLFAYCKEENLNVLFTLPSSVSSEDSSANQNTIKDLCQAYGFPVLDQVALIEEYGLDMERDCFSIGHTNIHGALKISDYLANYLAENYGFKDKRGDPAYASWDEAVEKYAEVAAPYVLDIEWNGEERDNTLDAPELAEPTVDGMTVEVSWGGISGADGYRIYRKAKTWEAVATVESGTTAYTDKLEEAGTYTYTVVGYREENGTKCWGRFDYSGVKAVVNTGKK